MQLKDLKEEKEKIVFRILKSSLQRDSSLYQSI